MVVGRIDYLAHQYPVNITFVLLLYHIHYVIVYIEPT